MSFIPVSSGVWFRHPNPRLDTGISLATNAYARSLAVVSCQRSGIAPPCVVRPTASAEPSRPPWVRTSDFATIPSPLRARHTRILGFIAVGRLARRASLTVLHLRSKRSRTYGFHQTSPHGTRWSATSLRVCTGRWRVSTSRPFGCGVGSQFPMGAHMQAAAGRATRCSGPTPLPRRCRVPSVGAPGQDLPLRHWLTSGLMPMPVAPSSRLGRQLAVAQVAARARRRLCSQSGASPGPWGAGCATRKTGKTGKKERVEVPHRKRSSDPSWPRIVRSRSRGRRRKCDRGARRPGIEPRKIPVRGAEGIGKLRRQHRACRHREARTGPRVVRDPVHARTLLAQAPGDPTVGRGAVAVVRAGKPKGSSRRCTAVGSRTAA
jgi:hypothetical protein